MLSDAFLKKLDSMNLLLSRPAQGGSGARRSKAQGGSVEFSDFRDYAQGDDLRRVDWNAAARFDKLFVKLFLDERRTCVSVVLDASASMALEEDKWAAAQNTALLTVYLALRGGDTVRLTALGAGGILECGQLSTRRDFLKAARFLASLTPARGEARTEDMIPRLSFGARGACVLVSDFLFDGGYERALRSLSFKRQEAFAAQVLSGGELSPAPEGAVRLIDSETGAAMEYEAGPRALAEYHRALDAFLNGLASFCTRMAIPRALIDARDDFEQTALGTLARAGLVR